MRRRLSDRAIIAALRETLGKVCLAAERLGCPQSLIYERARTSRKIAEVIHFFRGKLLDAAESSLWKAVLAGEAWAVRLTFDLWGASRDFGDGAEAWHSPNTFQDAFPPGALQSLVKELLDDTRYVAYCQACAGGADPGDLRGERQPRPLEDGATPGAHRPGDCRHDHRPERADPGG